MVLFLKGLLMFMLNDNAKIKKVCVSRYKYIITNR